LQASCKTRICTRTDPAELARKGKTPVPFGAEVH
jgi:hypothetical protein